MEEFSPFNCCLSFVFYVAWGVGGGEVGWGGGGVGGSLPQKIRMPCFVILNKRCSQSIFFFFFFGGGVRFCCRTQGVILVSKYVL